MNKKIALVIVFFFSLALYWHTLDYDFTNWDDVDYVVENEHIRAVNWENIQYHFQNYIMGNYHPLTMISLSVDYKFYQLNAKGFHFTNIVIHTLSAGLLFYLIILLTQNIWISLFAALLFVVHPMNVESVVWISERKNVLYAFFFLAGLITYLKYRDTSRIIFLIFTGILFLYSLLSKGVAVTFPVVMILIDWCFYREKLKKNISAKAIFLIIALMFGILAIKAQQSSDAISTTTLPIIAQILKPFLALTLYLVKILFPIKLSAFYPNTILFRENIALIGCLAPFLLTGLGVLFWRKCRQNNLMVFGMLFFIVNIFPLLQILPYGNILIADRNIYIASIGIFIVLAEGISKIITYYPNIRYPIVIGVGIYLFLLTFKNNTYAKNWDNSISLWSSVIDQYDEVPTAYLNRGKAYEDQGNYQLAIADWTKAVAIDQRNRKAYYNLGNAQLRVGDYTGAIQNYTQAVKVDPGFKEAFNNRCKALFLVKKYDLAIVDCNKAIFLDQNYIIAYYNRGNAYYNLSEFAKAIADLTVVISHAATKDAYLLRGNAHYLTDNYAAALQDYNLALKIDPNYASIYYGRANLYLDIGEKQKALSDFEKLINLYTAIGNKEEAAKIKNMLNAM